MTCEFQASRDCVSVHLLLRKDVSGPSAGPGGKRGTHRAELPQRRCPQTNPDRSRTCSTPQRDEQTQPRPAHLPPPDLKAVIVSACCFESLSTGEAYTLLFKSFPFLNTPVCSSDRANSLQPRLMLTFFMNSKMLSLPLNSQGSLMTQPSSMRHHFAILPHQI